MSNARSGKQSAAATTWRRKRSGLSASSESYRIKIQSPMATKEDLREANRVLEQELQAQNQENERLKQQIIESATQEVKEAIAEEQEDLISDMTDHLRSVRKAEEKVWEIEGKASQILDDLEEGREDLEQEKEDLEEKRESLDGTIRAGITLAVVNWWIVVPVGLIAGVVGEAGGRVLVDQTAWTAPEILVWSAVAAVAIPMAAAALRAIS